ncbi:hypothetical protein [Microbacterium azadirachtae]|uniref:Uncharacterized protein n=1 Tax=Microbacterium azadirachtae TaxID=582680 RepID=A0A0F0LGQ5_9MICO|nr:hypothetical protein [Microbacterium azadirachtae]KJL30711.1 hypothetical protein RS86_03652 [Microbacterium azadirachtae]
MKAVLLSNNITPQGTQHLLKAYAGMYYCTGTPRICQLKDQREINAVVNLTSYTNYYNWPVGGKMGLQTMYCEQQGLWRCPNWVTFAILYPGVNNPYTNRGAAPSPDDAIASELSSDSRMLTTKQAAEQAEILDSAEIQELSGDISSGETVVSFSYEALPTEISVR